MIRSDFKSILDTLNKILNSKKKFKKDFRYGNGNSGKQIVKILERVEISSQRN